MQKLSCWVQVTKQNKKRFLGELVLGRASAELQFVHRVPAVENPKRAAVSWCVLGVCPEIATCTHVFVCVLKYLLR